MKLLTLFLSLTLVILGAFAGNEPSGAWTKGEKALGALRSHAEYRVEEHKKMQGIGNQAKGGVWWDFNKQLEGAGVRLPGQMGSASESILKTPEPKSKAQHPKSKPQEQDPKAQTPNKPDLVSPPRLAPPIVSRPDPRGFPSAAIPIPRPKKPQFDIFDTRRWQDEDDLIKRDILRAGLKRWIARREAEKEMETYLARRDAEAEAEADAEADVWYETDLMEGVLAY